MPAVPCRDGPTDPLRRARVPAARPTPVRDRDRSAVYAAEAVVAALLDRAPIIVEAAGSRLALPVERRFGDLSAVQRYLDRVLALDWVREQWPRAAEPVVVRRRRGAARAHYQRAAAVIAVPGTGVDQPLSQRWALRELVLLHELAHHLAADDDTGPAHGRSFTGRVVALATGVIGPEVGLLLRITYTDAGITPG